MFSFIFPLPVSKAKRALQISHDNEAKGRNTFRENRTCVEKIISRCAGVFGHQIWCRRVSFVDCRAHEVLLPTYTKTDKSKRNHSAQQRLV